jgi:hypothetical protein
MIDIDVDLSQSAIVALSAASIGANGLLYASCGLAAYFVNKLFVRRADANFSREIDEMKA